MANKNKTNGKYRALANVFYGKLAVRKGQVIDSATMEKFPKELHNRFQEISVEVVTESQLQEQAAKAK